MDLIQIERTKLNFLLHEQELELKEYQETMKKKKQALHDQEEERKLTEFLEQRRQEAVASKKEANVTRQLVKEVKEDASNENVVNLLSNFQGNWNYY